MSKPYTPGDDADAIIARHVAKGNFTSADVARLRTRIDAADAAYRRGEFRKSPGTEAMKANIISRGEARLRAKS